MPTTIPPPLNLVIGDEEFLVSRAVDAVRRQVLDTDPAAEVYEREASTLEPMDLLQVLSPSLFGGRRLLILRSAQDLSAAQVRPVLATLDSLDSDLTVVVQHVGGAKGKALLDGVRGLRPVEVSCAKLVRTEDRQAFLREEFRRFGGTVTADAAAAIAEAVGSDLREISAVVAQLIGDTEGVVDAAAVAAYHRGRAEVTGFSVADQAVTGNLSAALTNLRWALNIGVPPVLIADALADGVRSVARVAGAGNGDPFALAPRLGMPPWKVKRARAQGRGWTEAGLRRALGVVATLNADVKGAAADPLYALESAVRQLAAVKAGTPR
jgi:DNA polymerase-3 subunit delta